MIWFSVHWWYVQEVSCPKMKMSLNRKKPEFERMNYYCVHKAFAGETWKIRKVGPRLWPLVVLPSNYEDWGNTSPQFTSY